MFSIIVTLIFFLFFITKYKKGIIVTAFLIQPLTYIGCGIDDINLYYIAAAISVLAVILGKTRMNIKTYPKLLVLPTTMMATSYLITNTVSHHPNTITILGNIVTQFMFPVALWCVLDSKSNVRYAIKCLVGMCVASIVGMVLELIFRHNYFTDFVQEYFVISDFIIDADTVRFGLKRTNSIFSYFSTFGTFCCLSSFIIWLLVTKLKIKNRLYVMLMFLLPFAAFTTGSRAVFLAVFCILIGLFTQKRIMQTKSFKFLFIVCLLMLPLVYEYFSTVVDSIVNSNTTKAADGSSSELRLLQWEVCLPYFLQAPIWGNGRMYIWEVVAPENPLLLGAESIWFSLFVDYGIMGVITYVIMILGCIFLLRRYNSRLIFMPIGYFFILSLSPDTGIQYNLLLTFVILVVKIYIFLYKTNSLSIKHETNQRIFFNNNSSVQ